MYYLRSLQVVRFTIIPVQMQKQDPVLEPQNQVLIWCQKRWNRMRLRKFKASFDSAKTGTTLVTDFRDLKMLRFVLFFDDLFLPIFRVYVFAQELAQLTS